MKASELIRELKKLPADTEIVLWQWNGKTSIFRQLSVTCNPHNPKKKQFSLGTPVPESVDPVYLGNLED